MSEVAGRSRGSVLRWVVREVKYALWVLFVLVLFGFGFAVVGWFAGAHSVGWWSVDPRLPAAFLWWVRPLLFVVAAFSFLLTLLRWASLEVGADRRVWPVRVLISVLALYVLWVLSSWVVVDGLIVMVGTGIVLAVVVVGVRSAVLYWRSEREWRDSDLDTLGGYDVGALEDSDRDRLGSVDGR